MTVGCGASRAVPPAANASPPVWWNASSSTSPPVRADAAFALDAGAGYDVLFGGFAVGVGCAVFTECPLGDTWEYENGVWANVTPPSPNATNTPSPRWGSGFVFDPLSGGLLLFGGSSAATNGINNPGLNDTWEFVGGAWHQVCLACVGGTTAPSARWDMGFAFDPLAGRDVLFGGETTQSGVIAQLNDTWTYQNGSWANVTPIASPTPREAPGMAYDGARAALVMFGGIPATNDTWEFSQANWTRLHPLHAPSPRGDLGLVADPFGRGVILFGGCGNSPCTATPSGETWRFFLGDWTNQTGQLSNGPSTRSFPSIALIPRGRAVMFGGDNAGAQSNDTWWYSYLLASPVNLSRAATDVRGVVSISSTVLGGIGTDSYAWSGLPGGCVSVDQPLLLCSPNATGTTSVDLTITDGASQVVRAPPATLVVNPSPSVSATVNRSSAVAPAALQFDAVATQGTPPFGFSWVFGDGGRSTVANTSHTFTGAGTYSATIWANDSGGGSVSQSVSIAVYDRLALAVAASPSKVGVGATVTLWVNVSGGKSPFQLSYHGLPTGCIGVLSSSNGSVQIGCQPSAAGTFNVTVSVSDGLGQRATAQANLSVAAPSGTSSPSAARSLGMWWWAIVLGVVVIAVAGVLYWRRRRPPPIVPMVPDDEISPANLYVPPKPRRR